MSVTLEEGGIVLRGRCRVEDAEPLLALLLESPGCTVHLSEAITLHSAVVQVLLASGAAVAGAPADSALRRWLVPLLRAGGGTIGIERDAL